MTKSQRRFAAALQAAGYSATESATLAAPTTPAQTAALARARRPYRGRPASYAADAHPWAHDEE